MPPIEPRPYVAWIRLNSEATRPIASSHETSRHGSVIVFADHRLEDAFAVIGVTPGEAAFDARVAAVRLAVLVRHHANHLVAAHFGLERATNAAIGAGRDRRPFRLAMLDDRLLDERAGRAGLHAGAAGDALGFDELLVHPGGNDGVEATARDRQRERALHFLARPHTARADDALGGVEGEIGIRVIDAGVAVARAAETVAHLLKPDRRRGVE